MHKCLIVLFHQYFCCYRAVYLFKGKAGDTPTDHKFYRNLYPQIIEDIEVNILWKLKLNHNDIFTIPNIKTANFYIDITIFYSMMQKKIVYMYCLSLRILFYYIFQRIETNWRTGRHTLQRIHCRSETSKGVYCLQYDETRIISGLRDNTIKVWKSKMVRTRIKFTSLFMIFQNK